MSERLRKQLLREATVAARDTNAVSRKRLTIIGHQPKMRQLGRR
jgi:hypothetical protein